MILRGREEGVGCRFVQGSGFALPVRDGAVALVTLNGVLEWAGLYQGGNPRARQLDMLREARRVLAPAGHLAVAIENRFALESWLGLRDTHTGIAGPTLLPRWVAGALTRVRTSEDCHDVMHWIASAHEHATGIDTVYHQREDDLLTQVRDALRS